MSEISSTKESIFDTFIEMVSTFGYESVSIRDIAKRLGLSVSALYHHFESKDKLLDEVYGYYDEHYFDTRIPVETMKKRIETDDAETFILALTRNYVSDDPKKQIRMILITKIVYMRLFQDATANAMFLRHNLEDYAYVVELLQHGIDFGRIQPDFDMEIFARVLTGSMMAMGIEAFANPNYTVGLLDYEVRVREMLARLYGSALL